MTRFRHLLLVTTALTACGLGAAAGGPNGPTVVGGSATVTNPGSANVTVNQQSDKAIINWRLFDVGVNERVQFVQPNSGSIVLNRVIGGLGPSQIFGTVDANGRVFIINRDGILFGPNAVINTAGFLATTHDIRNDDFMAGRFNFNIPGRPDASIVNLGTITATSGGFAALVAPGVRNSGTITATLGNVTLASGNGFSLDFYGDRLVTLAVGDSIASSVRDVATGLPLKALVGNDGKIKADGGRVQLTAVAARQVVDAVINTSGVIEANTVGTRNGMIVLGAATGATKPAGAPTQTVKISGTLKAAGITKGTKGGTIVVTGENIQVAGAQIVATGDNGGGKVLIGGDWGGGKPDKSLVSNPSAVLESFSVPTASTVSVDAATRIDASATQNGNGGKVILWADNQLSFAGTILALGGIQFGNGGFVETSAKSVDISGSVKAPGGTWLLDPGDLIIGPTLAASMAVSLNGGTNVTQETTASTPGTGNGDIFVTAPIVWNTSATLTLSAYRNIQINDVGPTGTIKNTGAGSLVLRADNTGTGSGTIVMNPATFSTRVDWTNSTGTVTVFYNPSFYNAPTNFTSGNGRFDLASPSQLTAYMLVNDASHLGGIATNLNGTYALGRDINVSGGLQPIGTIAPAVGSFLGILDGQNHTISNLSLFSPLSGVNTIGLFGSIGNTGVVRNLNFDHINVSANSNFTGTSQFVGVLAGSNFGSIVNVAITNSTISNNGVQSGVLAGGLVGQNNSSAHIDHASATVNVTVGDSVSGSQENNAGGLVGVNLGSITSSTASGNIFGGVHSNLGGLAGRNETSGTIFTSSAHGNVTIDSTATSQSVAGGFVGFNFGIVRDSSATGNVTGGNLNSGFSTIIGGFAGINSGGAQIINSTASGAVTGGNNSEAGGFAGTNNGLIDASHALGAVSSQSLVGGFVALNDGTITNSTATGAVTGNGFNTGGFVGENLAGGTISSSTASGNVTATTTNAVGGFVGTNESGGVITFSHATGAVHGVGGPAIGGFVGSNNAQISDSTATGNVTVMGGTFTAAGGFAGTNLGGSLLRVSATGNVNIDSMLAFAGGLVGFNGGSIDQSNATGPVTTTGSLSFTGGLAGTNFGEIRRSFASGAVTAGDNSFVGGLVGFNVGVPGTFPGTISQSYALGHVTGGTNSFVGGLAGVNLGALDQTYAAGLITGGPHSTTGGLVALGSLPSGFDPGIFGGPPPPGFPSLTGTVTNSYWDTTTTGQSTSAGGTPQTTAQLASGTRPAGFDPGVWTSTNGFYPCLNGACSPPPQPGPPAPFHPEPLPPPPLPHPQPEPPIGPVVISPQLTVTNQLLKDPTDTKSTDPVVTVTATTPTAPGAPGTPGGPKPGGPNNAGRPTTPPWFGPNAILPSGMPALTETRFRNDEVVFQLGNGTAEQIAEVARKLGLEILAMEDVGLLGRKVYRLRLPSGLPVREAIKVLQANKFAAQVQPLYLFELVQAPAAPADNQGDSAQYIVSKLRLPEVHTIATGKDVLVAVVDSAIDADHPDLAGVIAAKFDSAGGEEKPHPHGTGMAGAIASHKRLLGIAPGARLLAIQAFGVNAGGAQGTSLAIVKGLNWAVEQGAKVINMSFAGPPDPILAQAIKGLREKGIVLIAAAGNAGPKSPKLFPGADPNVIAAGATDADDNVFKNSNRGYITVSAPGVDVLVPAPDGGYQLTTGTSVAAAHISGVVALLLERNPNLKPDEVKRLLTSTATKLKAKPEDVGAGLVDPLEALLKLRPKTATLQ